jgi:pyroglutamyl-peptidase
MEGQTSTQVVLVTGFEPFGENDVNPSALVADNLHGRQIGGARVVGIKLPVVHRRAAETLARAVDRFAPSAVIATGLASGRAELAIERVAINVLDFPIPDNDGAQPVEGEVVFGGPTAYFSNLPVKAIVSAWRAGGIPGYVSNTAGTYVCNEVLYVALHLAATRGFRAGLIHLPCLPEQVAQNDVPIPSMALDLMLSGVTRAIEITVTHSAGDIVLVTGAIC